MSSAPSLNAPLEQPIPELRSQAFYHSLLASLPHNILSKDRDGRFTYANQTFCDWIGKSLGEVIGRTDFDLFPADLAQRYRADDEKVMERGERLEATEEHQATDGQRLYVQVIKTPIRGSNDQIEGVQCTYWDVSGPNRAGQTPAAYSPARKTIAREHPLVEEAIRAAGFGEMSSCFDKLAAGYEGLVIAGASGWVSRHTLDGLLRAGIRPVALADNNPALWGSRVRGVSVLSPVQALAAYPNAVFVAAIFTHTPLRRQLMELGIRRVVSYAQLFHKFPAALLPYFAIDSPATISLYAGAVRKAAGLWADEESRALYAALLHWFVTLDSESVPEPLPADLTYFPDVLKLRDDEVFVDCGAFNGDTVSSYVAMTGGRYQRILALEPDPKTFRELTATVRDMERVTPLNAAAGTEPGRLPFLAAGSLASHAVSAGAEGLSIEGTVIHVDITRLDDLEPRPTYVKLDVEGFEREALAGGRKLLASHDTAFAVTLYHHMSDLWNLPLYIHEAAPDLKLFLRHYAEDWSETICYAIPADRVRRTLPVRHATH